MFHKDYAVVTHVSKEAEQNGQFYVTGINYLGNRIHMTTSINRFKLEEIKIGDIVLYSNIPSKRIKAIHTDLPRNLDLDKSEVCRLLLNLRINQEIQYWDKFYHPNSKYIYYSLLRLNEFERTAYYNVFIQRRYPKPVIITRDSDDELLDKFWTEEVHKN